MNLAAKMGRDAFHCVPISGNEIRDAVERVPTSFKGSKRELIREFLSRAGLLVVLTWLSLHQVRGAPAPANDRFSNRITLAGTNVTATATNSAATKESGEPDHAGNPGGKSVWWTWTAPTNGEAQIDTDASNFDTLLGIYTGASVSALSVVATNDDHGQFLTSRVRFVTTAGTAYQIAVDGYNEAGSIDSGVVTLALAFRPGPMARPSNDAFTNAVPLSGWATVQATNVDATREISEPLHGGKWGDTSIWWTWTAPQSGDVMVSTAGSSFDTLLAVYQGQSLSNLTELASNDDADAINDLFTSQVVFEAAAGVSYRIAVDGYDGDTGTVTLTVRDATIRLGVPTLSPGGTVEFIVAGPPGATNEIQASTDLVGWTPVGELVNTNGVTRFSDPTATNHLRRFYRALILP